MRGTATPSASSLDRIIGTACAAASLLTVMRTSSEPACASWATWMAVPSTSAVSVFVIDCTTTGCADPTGMPPTTTVREGRRRGMLIEIMVGPDLATGTRRAPPRPVSEQAVADSGWTRDVWIVEDEPAAGMLAAELCEACGAAASVFRAPLPYLAALRGPTVPMAVVLDWRLENALSAALFLATRHRHPR